MFILDELNERGVGTLPGLIGLEITLAEKGKLTGRLELRYELLAPNGYLHAATVVALADTSCGYGTFVSLPEGAEGFTTIELKSNFLETKREGVIRCEATLAHGAARHRCGTPRFRTRGRQADSPLSLHPDDPLPALTVAPHREARPGSLRPSFRPVCPCEERCR